MNLARPRQLRKDMTPPERRLWNVLKSRPEGFKFRRQQPAGPFVLDFFCHEAGVAIEVDGIAHDLGGNPERDEKRDAWLARKGIRTLRYRAVDIRDNLEAVLTSLLAECIARSPDRPLHRLRRSPSPAKAGEARNIA